MVLSHFTPGSRRMRGMRGSRRHEQKRPNSVQNARSAAASALCLRLSNSIFSPSRVATFISRRRHLSSITTATRPLPTLRTSAPTAVGGWGRGNKAW